MANKAEALAAVTIAVGAAFDEGTERENFMAALTRAYNAPGRAGDEAEAIEMAATVAHECEIELKDLLETAGDVWEETEVERVVE